MTHERIQKTELVGDLVCIQPVHVGPPGVSAPGYGGKAMPRDVWDLRLAGRYIPASTLRHVIRSSAAAILAHTAAELGKPLSAQAAVALATGYVAMKKKNGDNDSSGSAPQTGKSLADLATLEKTLWQRNPPLAMFGMWSFPSQISVSSAIPRDRTAWTRTPGVVRKPVDPVIVEALDESQAAAYEAMLRASADPDKAETGLMHYAEEGHEEIVAGAECDFSIVLRVEDEMLIGLTLAALRAFSADPVIGGYRAQGRGRIALALTGREVTAPLFEAPSLRPKGAVFVGCNALPEDDERHRDSPFEAEGELAAILARFDAGRRDWVASLDLEFYPRLSA